MKARTDYIDFNGLSVPIAEDEFPATFRAAELDHRSKDGQVSMKGFAQYLTGDQLLCDAYQEAKNFQWPPKILNLFQQHDPTDMPKDAVHLVFEMIRSAAKIRSVYIHTHEAAEWLLKVYFLSEDNSKIKKIHGLGDLFDDWDPKHRAEAERLYQAYLKHRAKAERLCQAFKSLQEQPSMAGVGGYNVDSNASKMGSEMPNTIETIFKGFTKDLYVQRKYHGLDLSLSAADLFIFSRLAPADHARFIVCPSGKHMPFSLPPWPLFPAARSVAWVALGKSISWG